jgi:hypothetical protein
MDCLIVWSEISLCFCMSLSGVISFMLVKVAIVVIARDTLSRAIRNRKLVHTAAELFEGLEALSEGFFVAIHDR